MTQDDMPPTRIASMRLILFEPVSELAASNDVTMSGKYTNSRPRSCLVGFYYTLHASQMLTVAATENKEVSVFFSIKSLS